MHTCTCYSQMCTHVKRSFHLIYQLSIVRWHMYIVCSVHSAYIGMQCMWCYKIQTMSMQVGTTLTYCVMYCTYRQCLTLLYVLAHKLLFTDLYSVLYLLILFVDSSNSTKVLFTFSGIFHISHSLIIDAICFYYKRVKCASIVSCTCMVSRCRMVRMPCTWLHKVGTLRS